MRKLLAPRFIRETKYPTWLSNVVLVQKANDQWRMCVGFLDLNKACPKDPYRVLSIDQLVNGTSSHANLSFLDAFSWYNRIHMDPRDVEKTAFIMEKWVYWNNVMSFGVKNAGATYQGMMDLFFKDHLSKNIEVFVNAVVVKRKPGCDHLTDLEEIFAILR